jgi:hypothetical protein
MALYSGTKHAILVTVAVVVFAVFGCSMSTHVRPDGSNPQTGTSDAGGTGAATTPDTGSAGGDGEIGGSPQFPNTGGVGGSPEFANTCYSYEGDGTSCSDPAAVARLTGRPFNCPSGGCGEEALCVCARSENGDFAWTCGFGCWTCGSPPKLPGLTCTCVNDQVQCQVTPDGGADADAASSPDRGDAANVLDGG